MVNFVSRHAVFYSRNVFRYGLKRAVLMWTFWYNFARFITLAKKRKLEDDKEMVWRACMIKELVMVRDGVCCLSSDEFVRDDDCVRWFLNCQFSDSVLIYILFRIFYFCRLCIYCFFIVYVGLPRARFIIVIALAISIRQCVDFKGRCPEILRHTLPMIVVLLPTLVSDHYAPQRVGQLGHATSPWPIASLMAEFLQSCRPRAMEQFTATSQKCRLIVQLVPEVTEDIPRS